MIDIKLLKNDFFTCYNNSGCWRNASKRHIRLHKETTDINNDGRLYALRPVYTGDFCCDLRCDFRCHVRRTSIPNSKRSCEQSTIFALHRNHFEYIRNLLLSLIIEGYTAYYSIYAFRLAKLLDYV